MQTAQTHLDSGIDTQIDIPALQVSWQVFDTVAHLRPIHSEADYDRTVTLMNALLDVAGDDEDHPLSWSPVMNRSTMQSKQQIPETPCGF